MMRTRILSLIGLIGLAVPVWGQVTNAILAPQRYDVRNNLVADDRRLGDYEANINHAIGRSNESGFEIQVQGTGAYTIDAEYAGATCDGISGHDATWLNKTSGTAPDSFYIKLTQKGDTTPKTYDCIVKYIIGGVTYTYTFHVTMHRRNGQIQTNFFRRPDAQQNCVVDNTNWEDTRGRCTIGTVWPTLAETPVGGTRIDDVTGAVLRRVSPLGTGHTYPPKSVSLTGRYVAIKHVTLGSLTGTYDTTDQTRKNATFGGFFGTADNVWYQTGDDGMPNPNGIYKMELSGGVVTTTLIYTWPVANEVVRSNDNSSQTASGGNLYIPFWTHNTVTLLRGSSCIIQVEPTVGAPICYDYGNHPFGRPDGAYTNGNQAFASGPDADGYRYLTTTQIYDPAGAFPVEGRGGLFMFFAGPGDTELTLLPSAQYALPVPDGPFGGSFGTNAKWQLHTGPSGYWYGIGAHSTSVCDGAGECWYLGHNRPNYVPRTDAGNQNENAGAVNLTRLRRAYQGTSYTHNALELGGVWTRVGTFRSGPNYYGCAWKAQSLCVLSAQSGSVEGYMVSNATLGGGNMTLTLTTNWGPTPYAHATWTAGVTTIKTYGIGGIANANGTFTVDSITNNTVVVACGACSGTYTSGGYAVTNAAAAAKTVANTDMMQIVRFGGEFGAFHYRMAAMNHATYPTGQGGSENFLSPYELVYPFATMSGDGKQVCWRDNEGIGPRGSVFCTDSGFDIDENTPPHHFDRHGRGIEVVGRTLTLHRTRGHCTVKYGTNRDFASATTIQMPPGMTQAKLTMTGGAKNYFRGVCDNFDVAVKSVIADSLPGSGTTDVAVSGLAPAAATKMVVEYGDTEAFGSNVEVACSAGSTCTATVAGNNTAGAVYYGVKWARADDVVVKREPTRIVSVP